MVDPLKRFNLGQVKKHHWMLVEVPVVSSNNETPVASSSVATGGELLSSCSSLGAITEQVNEQILRLMQSLGVDPAKTKESVLHKRYDHHAAIYYLLLERRIHLSSMSTATTEGTPQINKTAVRPTAAESPPVAVTPPVAVVPVTSVGGGTSRQRPALWSHNPPFRDSACGDSVDSERGSVGGSFLSPLMETAPSAIAEKVTKSNTYSVDEGVEDWSEGQSPLGTFHLFFLLKKIFSIKLN